MGTWEMWFHTYIYIFMALTATKTQKPRLWSTVSLLWSVVMPASSPKIARDKAGHGGRRAEHMNNGMQILSFLWYPNGHKRNPCFKYKERKRRRKQRWEEGAENHKEGSAGEQKAKEMGRGGRHGREAREESEDRERGWVREEERRKLESGEEKERRQGGRRGGGDRRINVLSVP